MAKIADVSQFQAMIALELRSFTKINLLLMSMSRFCANLDNENVSERKKYDSLKKTKTKVIMETENENETIPLMKSDTKTQV